MYIYPIISRYIQLDNLLNEDGRGLLFKSYNGAEAFINGFCIAIMLMAEVYYGKDNLIESKEHYLRHLLHRPF